MSAYCESVRRAALHPTTDQLLGFPANSEIRATTKTARRESRSFIRSLICQVRPPFLPSNSLPISGGDQSQMTSAKFLDILTASLTSCHNQSHSSNLSVLSAVVSPIPSLPASDVICERFPIAIRGVGIGQRRGRLIMGCWSY